ncbi:tail fiber protein [Bacillus phage Pascal]|uniref:Tail fiber protein n=1 Tax=Bacillus phage Pascal TaxID=1540092 RepID=A0A0A0RNG6_9CAUD|nr:tail fiber protein [Bacillus phage Pascal]AIW03650.1 tail fiber protein [Bacillus phage Pascal]
MLTQLGAFSKLVADLPDVPNMSAAELKSYFDSSPEQLRKFYNNLVIALQSTDSVDSGAANIGVGAIAGLSGTNVQAFLSALKTLADSKTANTGDHKGTWGGYTVANFPIGVTRDQLFLITDTIYNNQSGDRYPTGVSLMNVPDKMYSFPQDYGMVVTMKIGKYRLTQFFFSTGHSSSNYGMWFRHWYDGDGYTQWQKVATTTDISDSIGSVVKGSKIQCGTTTITINGQSNASKAISFPESFSSAPAVVASVRNSSNPENFGDVTCTNPSTTGFTLVGRNNTQSQVTVSYSWIAMV